MSRTITLPNGNKRKYNGKILSPRINRGYQYVNVTKDGRSNQITVHRLVALTFIDNPHNKPQVNHIDGDKTNNHISNLEWCTAKENINHALSTGLNGSKVMDKNLNESDVRQIKMMILGGQDDDYIAEVCDSTPQRIRRIREGKAWQDVKVEPYCK